MALIEFKDYPSTETPLNAENLNRNFNYSVPTGGIVEFAGGTAPNGWLLCDGSAISRTDYADLFNVIGTNYGEGDGSTTFNLPNRKNKVGVGVDADSTYFKNLGDTYGYEVHTLTIAEMPIHTHYTGSMCSNAGGAEDATSGYGYTEVALNKSSYGNRPEAAGGSEPHNNIQPSIAMNYIIKC